MGICRTISSRPQIPPALELALADHYTLYRDTPPATTRAMVGGGMMTVDRNLLDRLPELEIIAVHGVGHDGIDREAVAARGIRIAITPDVLTEDVADRAIALWLAVDRRIAANDRAMRMGNWTVPLGRRASGRRIGLFGLGRIGGRSPGARSPLAARSSTPHVRPSWSRGTSCPTRHAGGGERRADPRRAGRT